MGRFTGVFRGKAVQVNGLSITAFVPQVYGEQPIVVSDFIGDVPADPGMGWVLFQAGNPEFPVWIGKLASAGDGGGTGGGTNEVWIGPNDPIPANPTIELWYDEDETPGGGLLPPGGTAGQVLTKNTATDFDTGWSTPVSLIMSGTEAAKPGVPSPGTQYFALNTWRQWLFDGTGWIIMEEPVQTSFNSVIGATTGTITTVGAKTFNYRRSNGSCFWDADVTITTVGTAAGLLTMTLPFAVPAGTAFIGNGREDASTGNLLQVKATGTTASVGTYNNAFPGGNGMHLIMSGRYRMLTGYS
jgi:hypothetical protein